MNWSRSVAVFFVLAATPAAAQPYPSYPQPEPYYGMVSPREVMRTVASLGLQPVSEPRLRGAVWIVRGAGREGTIVRVVVDSHTGRVIAMHAMRGPGPYMGPGEPGPYQPDPRYVMRDRPYEPDSYPPAPRPGQVYDAPPYGPRGGAAAVPDDDDDYDGPRMQPPGYVPHSSYSPSSPSQPRVSSKSETTRLASKPPSVPVPKARPSDLNAGTKPAASEAGKEEIKKEDVKKEEAKAEEKKDEAKKEEPKHEQASVPLTSPKSPETTGSIPQSKPVAQPPVAQPKKTEIPPVQPLE